MSDLPGWFTTAVVVLALAVGAALAAFWHAVWLGASPNILLFALVCGAAGLMGVSDTFRSMTVRPLDPTLVLVEIIVGGVATLLLVHHRFLPFIIAAIIVFAVRGNSGRLTTLLVNLYHEGKTEVARRTRGSFTSIVLILEVVFVIAGLGSNLEKSLSLWQWGFAPIALAAGAAGLMLISGAEYEVMRTRFLGGQVSSDASFGTGWWGPAGGLIAAVLIIGAILAPTPAIFSVHQISHFIYEHAAKTVKATGSENLGGTTNLSTASSAKGHVLSKSNLGLGLFVVLLLAFIVLAGFGLYRYSRRLGQDVGSVLLGYWQRTRAFGIGAAAFFVGFYRLLVLGIRDGDWAGLLRMLRLWLHWFLEIFSVGFWRNRWRHLGIRSFSHKEGASFAAEAAARTIAGSAWNLAAGDPRRRIREIYRQFLMDAKSLGLGRRPNQTPAVYQHTLAKVEPATAEGLVSLTSAYEWARFSHHPVEQQHLEGATSGWERISKVFSVRRPKPAEPGAKGKEKPDAGAMEERVEGRAVQQVHSTDKRRR